MYEKSRGLRRFDISTWDSYCDCLVDCKFESPSCILEGNIFGDIECEVSFLWNGFWLNSKVTKIILRKETFFV